MRDCIRFWSCSTTANRAPRDDDGKAWYSTRVHLSATTYQVRPAINITFVEADQGEEHAQESDGPGEDSHTEDQAIGESGSEPQYDESSDEADEGANDESGNYFQGEIGSSTTRLRFGRVIRFNNHLIQ